MKHYIGIDIGGTNISLGIVDEEYNVVHTQSIKTKKDRPYPEICLDIISLINENLKRYPHITWVGIGCPGICNFHDGVVYAANNLRWYGVKLKRDIESGVNIPVFIENDANCAAYGEFVAGAANGCDSAVVITLGTGVGSGIIIDGHLFYGENYSGGEIGHTVIDINGPMCTCGRRGCFEAFSSGTGLIRMTQEALEKNPSSKIKQVAEKQGRISARTAFAAAKQGDETAKIVVGEYIRHLACGMGNIINVFRPDCICIGGGICNEGDSLFKPLKEMLVGAYLPAGNEHMTRILQCELGNNAGIIGAAMLWKQFSNI